MKADLVVKNGWVVTPQDTVQGGVAISDGKFVAIGTSDTLPDGKQVIDAKGLHILPGAYRRSCPLPGSRRDPQRRLRHRLDRGRLRRHHDRHRHAKSNSADGER